ncbi:hypothetical protein [Metallosphaera hakonensis]|uniref:Uncharacterized protein n=1 Tax=Metallosphaera hakonensis JCM 8857 = DSM 7519 TaxID=1293036 RepID=A0A2U9IVL1_9CREN|nr:hypothetical protein [Metallosphaera hakonensis]AWS00112.1 hypothetical protein DFR87_10935 [Metallosphaera hakonensis JCM 8857 = DSM 7519]
MLTDVDILLTVGIIALAHGLEPDHISSARLVRQKRKLVYLALFHSVGFLIVATPLSMALIYFSFLKPSIEFASNIVGIIFGALLLISAILRLDMEIEPKGTGLLQGMLNVSPSKVMAVILAMDTRSLIAGTFVILWFSFVTSLSIVIMGLATLRIPSSLERSLDITIGIITVTFFSLSLFNLI